MKLVVGLGNPGVKYANNRHNIGRQVVDWVVGRESSWEKSENGEICKKGNLIFVKAGEGAFMNESGRWVGRLKNFYKIENKDVVVIYDDLDLEMGRVLVSDRGPKIHNGVNSVIEAVGEGFVHVRCGVDDRGGDRSVPGEVYVLKDFPGEKMRDELVEKAVDELDKVIQNGS